MRKKKGFTLVELLVVIAIIALLMGILMPALARVRQIAFRMICGTNLSGIGKAMLIYANDYEDEFPRAGGRNSQWSGRIADWLALTRNLAFGLNPADGSGGYASISSSFYLLVKYAEVTPKSFVCKSDSGTTQFKASNYQAGNRDLIDLWDFGNDQDYAGSKHCSYSYHFPYGLYALTTSSEPGMAVAADRNPWIRSPAADAKEPGLLTNYNPTGSKEAVNRGNAMAHQEEGQNVLFMDSHVYFEKRSHCGINDDNIYTFQTDNTDLGKQRGGYPIPGQPASFAPKARLDSFLVHDGEGGGGSGTGPGPAPKGRCFLADTPVWINGALVQISKAAAGQKVGCLAAAKQIEKIQVHEGTFDYRDITLETGNRISVVDAHCFMLDSGQWVAAQNLQNGMKLKSLNGTVAIKSVVTRTMPFVGKVFNLKVSGSDQYMVGKDGVVVRDF